MEMELEFANYHIHPPTDFCTAHVKTVKPFDQVSSDIFTTTAGNYEQM